jgi:ABC-2 type transport system ATP-binding protein
MTPALALNQLSYVARKHFYSKPTQVVQGLTFSVAPGEICGFLGANGAGKTTTLRLLLGLLRPTSGDGQLFGHSIFDPQARQCLGYLPERPLYPLGLTGYECVVAHGLWAGLGLTDARRRADALLEQVALAAHKHRTMRTYSKGMLQRVGIAQALVGSPKLLILDEPLSGLDPLGRHAIRQIISEQGARGCAVFFSTHILADVELICDRVAILNQGRLAHTGTPAELVERAKDQGGRIEVIAAGVGPQLHKEVVALCLSDQRLRAGHRFVVADSATANRVAARLQHGGARLQLLAPFGGSRLESLFTSAPPVRSDHAAP